MRNEWPGGRRHAMYQSEHEAWNATHYPGTRQLCSECNAPTGRCEDDELLTDDGEPLCPSCWTEAQAALERLHNEHMVLRGQARLLMEHDRVADRREGLEPCIELQNLEETLDDES